MYDCQTLSRQTFPLYRRYNYCIDTYVVQRIVAFHASNSVARSQQFKNINLDWFSDSIVFATVCLQCSYACSYCDDQVAIY